MFKQKLPRSLVFFAALMSAFTIWSNTPVAHATDVASSNQKSFLVAGGGDLWLGYSCHKS